MILKEFLLLLSATLLTIGQFSVHSVPVYEDVAYLWFGGWKRLKLCGDGLKIAAFFACTDSNHHKFSVEEEKDLPNIVRTDQTDGKKDPRSWKSVLSLKPELKQPQHAHLSSSNKARRKLPNVYKDYHKHDAVAVENLAKKLKNPREKDKLWIEQAKEIENKCCLKGCYIQEVTNALCKDRV